MSIYFFFIYVVIYTNHKNTEVQLLWNYFSNKNFFHLKPDISLSLCKIHYLLMKHHILCFLLFLNLLMKKNKLKFSKNRINTVLHFIRLIFARKTNIRGLTIILESWKIHKILQNSEKICLRIFLLTISAPVRAST